MPASTYAELYQFEDILLPQYSAVLTAAGVTNHYTRATGNLATPRVRLELKMLGTTDHTAVVYGGATMFDVWRFTLTATVITGRNQNNSTHQTYLGKVRYLLLAPSTSSTINTALPYHSVCKSLAAEEPSSTDTVQEEDQDVTVLQFGGLVQIDSSAWPNSAP